MITITRRFEFDAAHRVLGHEGKCKDLHGHRYVIELTVTAPELDSLGRVIDFSVVKDRVGYWIDEHWDHNVLLNREDTYVRLVNEGQSRLPFIFMSSEGIGINPTAENIAKDLAHVASQMLPEPIEVVKVRCYETPNCYAEYYAMEEA